ncbi:MAG: hypothetical protein HC808_02015 [Candidatus Competibacteraceae bacterium]|nr:hypothetical protein [Candidatus Competibacteraceae bacterium]
MLAKLKQFGPVISLVPESAVQCLDFGFNSHEIRVARAFLNEPGERSDDPPTLISLYPDREGGQLVDAGGRIPVHQEAIYSLTGARALEPFWVLGCLYRSFGCGIPARTALIVSIKARSTGRE